MFQPIYSRFDTGSSLLCGASSTDVCASYQFSAKSCIVTIIDGAQTRASDDRIAAGEGVIELSHQVTSFTDELPSYSYNTAVCGDFSTFSTDLTFATISGTTMTINASSSTVTRPATQHTQTIKATSTKILPDESDGLILDEYSFDVTVYDCDFTSNLANLVPVINNGNIRGLNNVVLRTIPSPYNQHLGTVEDPPASDTACNPGIRVEYIGTQPTSLSVSGETLASTTTASFTESVTMRIYNE